MRNFARPFFQVYKTLVHKRAAVALLALDKGSATIATFPSNVMGRRCNYTQQIIYNEEMDLGKTQAHRMYKKMFTRGKRKVRLCFGQKRKRVALHEHREACLLVGSKKYAQKLIFPIMPFAVFLLRAKIRQRKLLEPALKAIVS